ncbi:Transcription factor bHLH69 [Quillaja saponaria]|uniref:Transcription factor bHLH69 n=1 Tax=Quillaja saponaria TaxID=32244 RepID=A0AAD7VEN0_QUISA|nr:Transcription factor bHLH69 [Quillaja saponaria]
MLQSICSPVGSTPALSGVTETQKNMFYCDARKACGPKPADSSIDIDVPKQILSWTPDNQCDQADKLSRTQHHILTENHASWPQESIGHNYNVSLHHTRETVAAPGSSSKQQPSLSKQKSIATDRQRRERISEKLNALHELLPHPAEGGQASVVDDIIDHVKHLQLQIKELSQRKLGGESTAIPLVFREGYGHYINQQMSSEPLEEMMAKLLEEHPMTAAQLLETKGLFLLPIALVEDLSKAF